MLMPASNSFGASLVTCIYFRKRQRLVRPNCTIKCEMHTDKITTCHTLTCSSPKNNTDKQSEGSQAGRPSEDTLEKTAVILAKELIKIFIAKPDHTLYRQDIVFENRISNKVLLI